MANVQRSFDSSPALLIYSSGLIQTLEGIPYSIAYQYSRRPQISLKSTTINGYIPMSLKEEDSKPSAKHADGTQPNETSPDRHTVPDDRRSSFGFERVVACNADTSCSVVAGVEDDSSKELDWVLTNYDTKNSEPQSLEEELKRLQALRSYLILDSEREHQFERLTALASRIFKVPIALVSLVDLGRQWFMSNRGLGDVRETPRDQAFCSHAIISKEDILTIKDAKLDPRFANNPLVTGPPYIRFYAGAPLETPEGYKLGTFCIIDTKPWPNGLDFDRKQNLRELAGLVVEVLVARRRKRERELEKNAQLVACTAHDLLTPLSGIELSLHLLNEDQDFQQKIAQSHLLGMKNVEMCSEIIQEVCTSVRATYTETKSSFEQSLMTSRLERVNINSLVHRLYKVMEPVEKEVPLMITVDDNVPQEIITDPSKVFRGALNYLTVACQRTKNGMIALRFFVKNGADDEKRSLLFVTCEDTAPAVKLNVYEHLFKPPTTGVPLFEEEFDKKDRKSKRYHLELCLFSVACEMNVVGGEYGFRPRSEDDKGCQKHDKESGIVSGSVFWFCIPCSEWKVDDSEESIDLEGTFDSKMHSSITRQDAAMFEQSISGSALLERKKRALVIEDSNVVRKMLTKILTKLDYDVAQADNGMEGLEKLKSSLFDLTLCDFLMPIMDGLDCVQQYRDWEKYHRPWIRQRIVGISAHATSGDVERGMKVGMDDYRNKPVTFKVLSELIECKEQLEMSNRLDEVERRETSMRNTAEGDSATNSESRTATLLNGRPCTCLVITPKSEDEHSKLMQHLIKSAGWQSTVACSEEEALTWLKMRMWDLVLVDEAFSTSISAFREWESKKRKTPQKSVTLMTETVDVCMARHTTPPEGVDALAAKPMSLSFLDKLLHRTFFALNEATTTRTSGR